MGSRRAAGGGARSGHVGERSPAGPAHRPPLALRPGTRRATRPNGAPPPTAHGPEIRRGDQRQAVTIAEVADLLRLGPAIGARRRFAPPASDQLLGSTRSRNTRQLPTSEASKWRRRQPGMSSMEPQLHADHLAFPRPHSTCKDSGQQSEDKGHADADEQRPVGDRVQPSNNPTK